MRRHTSVPSMSGSPTSRSTAAGRRARTPSSAAAPSVATCTPNPVLPRYSRMREAMAGSSSTTSTSPCAFPSFPTRGTVVSEGRIEVTARSGSCSDARRPGAGPAVRVHPLSSNRDSRRSVLHSMAHSPRPSIPEGPSLTSSAPQVRSLDWITRLVCPRHHEPQPQPRADRPGRRRDATARPLAGDPAQRGRDQGQPARHDRGRGRQHPRRGGAVRAHGRRARRRTGLAQRAVQPRDP